MAMKEEEPLDTTLLPGQPVRLKHNDMDCTVVVTDMVSGLIVRFPLLRGHACELIGNSRVRIVVREPDENLTGVQLLDLHTRSAPEGGVKR